MEGTSCGVSTCTHFSGKHLRRHSRVKASLRRAAPESKTAQRSGGASKEIGGRRGDQAQRGQVPCWPQHLSCLTRDRLQWERRRARLCLHPHGSANIPNRRCRPRGRPASAFPCLNLGDERNTTATIRSRAPVPRLGRAAASAPITPTHIRAPVQRLFRRRAGSEDVMIKSKALCAVCMSGHPRHPTNSRAHRLTSPVAGGTQAAAQTATVTTNGRRPAQPAQPSPDPRIGGAHGAGISRLGHGRAEGPQERRRRPGRLLRRRCGFANRPALSSPRQHHLFTHYAQQKGPAARPQPCRHQCLAWRMDDCSHWKKQPASSTQDNPCRAAAWLPGLLRRTSRRSCVTLC